MQGCPIYYSIWAQISFTLFARREFLAALSKSCNKINIRNNLKVLSWISKLTLTSTYLIMEQIVKILLLKVVTSVHPTGF